MHVQADKVILFRRDHLACSYRPPTRLRRGWGAGACGPHTCLVRRGEAAPAPTPSPPRHLVPGDVSWSYEQASDKPVDAEGRSHIGMIAATDCV